MQDGDRVHEVGQGAEEPSNPIKGRALPEQFLHIGPMVQSWSTTQSVEKYCKRKSSTCPCPSRTTFSRCSRSALWISVRRYALVGGGTAHDDDDHDDHDDDDHNGDDHAVVEGLHMIVQGLSKVYEGNGEG